MIAEPENSRRSEFLEEVISDTPGGGFTTSNASRLIRSNSATWPCVNSSGAAPTDEKWVHNPTKCRNSDW